MDTRGGATSEDSEVVRTLVDELESLKIALAKEKQARAAERAGRVRAEKKLRDYEVNVLTKGVEDVGGGGGGGGDDDDDDDDESATVAAADEFGGGDVSVGRGAVSTSYPLHPLGTFESCFSRRNGTPRQPQLVPMARGRVRLHSQVPNAALEGITEFSHVWLIYVFHANTDLQKSVGARDEANVGGGGGGGDVSQGQQRKQQQQRGKRTTALAKVRVPRLNGERRGVLATRSPHRPAPIGLSLAAVRAVDLERGILEVGGGDLVDGTPVLDVKPYVPFSDSPLTSGPPVVAPEWVAVESVELPGGEPLKLASVKWGLGAKERVVGAWRARGGARRSLYDDPDDLTLFVEQVLSRDIRSAHQRRQHSGGVEEEKEKEKETREAREANNKDDVSTASEEREDEGASGGHDGGKWEVVLDGIAIRYDITPEGEVVIASGDKA